MLARVATQSTVEAVLSEYMKFLLDGGGGRCTAGIETIIGHVGGVVQGHFDRGVDISLEDSYSWQRTKAGARRWAVVNPAPHRRSTPRLPRMPLLPANIDEIRVASVGTQEESWLGPACSFAFAGFLRKCEFLPFAAARFDPGHDPTVSDVAFQVGGEWVRGHEAGILHSRVARSGRVVATAAVPTRMIYRAKHTKRPSSAASHAKYRNVGIEIIDDGAAHQITAVADMWAYLSARNASSTGQLSADSPLFVKTGTTEPVSYTSFNGILKRAIAAAGHDPAAYSSHSLRHGAASHAIYCGLAAAIVRRLGRWVLDSKALDVYIHNASHDARARANIVARAAPDLEFMQQTLVDIGFEAVLADPRRA